MRKKFFFIASFVVLGITGANAQSAKSKYFLVQLYADSLMQVVDTGKHEIALHPASGMCRVVVKEPGLFCIDSRKDIKEILLNIDGYQLKLRLTAQALRGKFTVLKTYINPDAEGESVFFTVKNGDVVYILNRCKDECHRVQIMHPKITVDADNKPTTGYKILDKYIFD